MFAPGNAHIRCTHPYAVGPTHPLAHVGPESSFFPPRSTVSTQYAEKLQKLKGDSSGRWINTADTSQRWQAVAWTLKSTGAARVRGNSRTHSQSGSMLVFESVFGKRLGSAWCSLGCMDREGRMNCHKVRFAFSSSLSWMDGHEQLADQAFNQSFNQYSMTWVVTPEITRVFLATHLHTTQL